MKELMAVKNYLDKQYDGGFNKFLQDTGTVCYVPSPAQLLYVIHPNLPDRVKNELKGMYDDIIFASTRNFPSYTEEDQRELAKAFEGLLDMFGLGMNAVSITPAVVVFTLPELRIDDERLNDLKEAASKLEGFARGCIVHSDGYSLFEGNNFKQSITSISISAPKRDKPITDDDLLNLQIALNSSKTLEEFLSQI